MLRAAYMTRCQTIRRVLLAFAVLFLQGVAFKNDRRSSVDTKSVLRKPAYSMSASDIHDIVLPEVNTSEALDLKVTDAPHPRLSWNAAVKSSVRVKESSRSCEEYMRLPASEYSVLSAEQIIRLSISEFRCTLPTMNFFGTKIQPILYVDVHVYPEFNKSEIVVLRAETAGSETAIKVNGTFNIQATNVVSAGIDRKGRKTLNSDTKLMVNVEVPPSRIPFRVIQTGGNFILQASLDIIVPTFLRVLSSDFHRWSEGNDVRDPLENASFLPIDGSSDSDSGGHGGSGSNSGGDHDSGI